MITIPFRQLSTWQQLDCAMQYAAELRSKGFRLSDTIMLAVMRRINPYIEFNDDKFRVDPIDAVPLAVAISNICPE